MRKHVNLLLVDDDTSLLKLLGMKLTSEGFTVTTTENRLEALRQLLRNKIDLVISNLRMDPPTARSRKQYRQPRKGC